MHFAACLSCCSLGTCEVCIIRVSQGMTDDAPLSASHRHRVCANRLHGRRLLVIPYQGATWVPPDGLFYAATALAGFTGAAEAWSVRKKERPTSVQACTAQELPSCSNRALLSFKRNDGKPALLQWSSTRPRLRLSSARSSLNMPMLWGTTWASGWAPSEPGAISWCRVGLVLLFGMCCSLAL